MSSEEFEKSQGTPPPPPPPPSDDTRMVDQLDTVTKDSEQKASEIFDAVEKINESLSDMEEKIKNEIQNTITWNIEMFEKLSKQFPDIPQFQEGLEKNREILKYLDDIVEILYNDQDETMTIMDKLQYQDIHRQKIERVINVMRSLALYMNHLFSSSKVKDEERVASARHIAGDNTEDLVDESDLEALIASIGNKK
ncbi:MAG TPA: chemotaxis protein [Campylobacterales bacterium]|nr:chemotaxis protein [Campylobacterales bacterium]